MLFSYFSSLVADSRRAIERRHTQFVNIQPLHKSPHIRECFAVSSLFHAPDQRARALSLLLSRKDSLRESPLAAQELRCVITNSEKWLTFLSSEEFLVAGRVHIGAASLSSLPTREHHTGACRDSSRRLRGHSSCLVPGSPGFLWPNGSKRDVSAENRPSKRCPNVRHP